MSKRKSPYIVATGADRPPLTVAQLLRATQEASLLGAELLTEAQILIKLSMATSDTEVVVREQLGKSTTMRLRGLVELLAGQG